MLHAWELFFPAMRTGFEDDGLGVGVNDLGIGRPNASSNGVTTP